MSILNTFFIQKDTMMKNLSIGKKERFGNDLARHVILPKPLSKYVPTDRLMTEQEWRSLGVQQSIGWEHYMIHSPEPHVMLFRREKDYQDKYTAKNATKQQITA